MFPFELQAYFLPCSVNKRIVRLKPNAQILITPHQCPVCVMQEARYDGELFSGIVRQICTNYQHSRIITHVTHVYTAAPITMAVERGTYFGVSGREISFRSTNRPESSWYTSSLRLTATHTKHPLLDSRLWSRRDEGKAHKQRGHSKREGSFRGGKRSFRERSREYKKLREDV